MRGVFWKLPGVSRLSPLQRGLFEAFGLVSLCSLAFVFAALRYADHLPHDLLTTFAQVGSALFIAYAVEVSSWMRISWRRGGDEENWLGTCIGLAICGLLGIGLLLVLSGGGGERSAIEELAFCWAVVSLGLMGLMVAVLPWAIYEWAHALRADYPED